MPDISRARVAARTLLADALSAAAWMLRSHLE
jgi:hypothetical protein